MVLSEKYWMADGEESRKQLAAAGEAMLAAGTGTGTILGAVLVVVASLTYSFLMLKNALFIKIVPVIGLSVHALGIIILATLARSDLHYLSPIVLVFLGLTALLYFSWYILIGITLIRLAKK